MQDFALCADARSRIQDTVYFTSNPVTQLPSNPASCILHPLPIPFWFTEYKISEICKPPEKKEYYPTGNFWHHSLPWFTALHFFLSLQRLFDLVN